MSGGATNERYVLGVDYDVTGLREFLQQLQIIPAALRELNGAINAQQLGSTSVFRERGRDLGVAFYRGLAAQAAGFKIDLGQFVVGQLGGQQTKAQMRELEQDATRLAARLQQLGVGTALGRNGTGAEVNAMKALQTAATQTSTSVTRLNAQVAFLLGQLREVAGVSVPRQLLDAQGNVRRGGPALAAAGVRSQDVPVNRTQQGAIDQGAARAFVQGQLEQRRTSLQRELAAVEAQRAQSLASRAVVPLRPQALPPIATAAVTPPQRPFVVDQGGAVLGRVGDAVLREVQATTAQTSATQANTRAQERVAAALATSQTRTQDAPPQVQGAGGQGAPPRPPAPPALPPLPPAGSGDEDDDDGLKRRFRNARRLGEFDETFADFRRNNNVTLPTAADINAQARATVRGVPNFGERVEQEQINVLREEARESTRRQQEEGRRDAFSNVGPEEEQDLIRSTAALAAAREREAARLAAGLSIADRDRIAEAEARNAQRRQRVIVAADAELDRLGVTPDVSASQAEQRTRLQAIAEQARATQTASQSDAQLRAAAEARVAAGVQSEATRRGTQEGRAQAGVTPETLQFQATQAARARAAEDAARADFRAARSQETLTRRAETRQSRLEFSADRNDRAERTRTFFSDTSIPLGSRLRAAALGGVGEDRQPLRSQFAEGFLGTGESTPIFQLGQAAKFSVFYGAAYAVLFQLSQGFAIAAQGAIQFEDALADLSVVTQRSRSENERFADSLGELGTDVGFTASQGVQAGARALGLFGATQSDQEAQSAVADASVSTAGRIAFLGNQQDLDATQLQLAGLVRAFSLSPFDQTKIEDTLAVLSRETGRPATEFLDAAAQIGTQARAAGFELPETGAQIATIATTTGDTPTAVAGYLAQIFAKADDPAVEQRLASVGVDVDGTTLAEQLRQLAELDLSPEVRNQINSSFGRGGRVAGALGVLQNEQGQIQRLTADAANAEEGLGEEQFQENIKAIGQQIRLTGAAFQELAKDLALTGAFDFFYGLIFATRELLEAGDQLVDLFNSLPRELRTVSFAILEVLAVTALIRGRGAGGLAGAAVGLASGVGTAGARTVSGITSAAGAFAGGTVISGTRQGLRDRFSGEDNASNRRGVVTGVFATVAGALLSVNEQQDLTKQIVSQFEDAQTAGGEAGTDVKGLRDAAAQFAEAAKAAEESQKTGIDDFTTLFIAPALRRREGGETQRIVDEGKERADVFTALAERTEAAQDRAAEQNPLTEVSSFTSAEALATQLGSLEARGFTASQRLALLNESFGAFIDFTSRASAAASTLPEAFTRGTTPNQGALILPGREEELAIGVGTAGLTGVQRVIDDLRKQNEDSFEEFRADSPALIRPFLREDSALRGEDVREVEANRDAANLLSEIDPAEIQSRLEAVAARELDNLGTATGSGIRILSPRDVARLEEVATEELRKVVGPAFDELPADVQRAFSTSAANSLRESIAAFSPGNATAENVAAFATSAAELVEPTAQREELFNGPTAGAAARTRGIESIIEQAEAGIDQIDPDRPEERIEAQRRIVFLYDMLFAAQKAEVDAAAQVAASLATLRVSQLPTEDVIGRLDVQIAAANDAVIADPSNENVAARNNLQEQRRAAERQRVASAATSGIDPGNQQALLNAQISTAESEVARLAAAVPDSQAFFDAERLLGGLYNQRAAYALQLAQAVATNAVPLTDDLGQANVAISNAELAIADARANGDRLGEERAINQRNQAVVSRDSVLEQDEADEAARLRARRLAQVVPGDARSANLAAIDNARADLNRADPESTEYFVAQAALAAAQRADIDQQVALYQAQQNSRVTPGDAIGGAVAQIRNADTALRNAIPGTEAYYAAIGDLANAQQAYSDALISYADVTRRLGIDNTDPVQTAAADLAAARDRLAAADTPDERAQGQLDVQTSQASEEAARFQQRISDLQVAEDLGRISNAQYLSYLDAERDRLQAVGNRTRQQQDQLNEVEQLLKSATEQIDSQFNLGNIRVPTVFEVRRAIGQGTTGNLVQTNTTNNQVAINGADLQSIIQYLQSIGIAATGIRTTSPRRG